MRWRIAAAVAAVFLGVAGCASITRGTSDQLQFDSVPTGAEVRTWFVTFCDRPCYPGAEAPPSGVAGDNNIPKAGPACVTPCTVQIKRNEKIVAHITKPGFEKESLLIYGKVAANGAVGFVGNALVGGVAGVLVDTVTGAALDLCPNPVLVNLRPLQQKRGAPVPPADPAAPPRDISAACSPPAPSGASTAPSSS